MFHKNLCIILRVKRDLKFFWQYRLIMVVFFGCILLTFFMPMISIDTYTEYNFYNTSYAEDYQSSYTPLATKITPKQLAENLFMDDQKLEIIKIEYANYLNWCEKNYSDGLWTKEEFDSYLASGEKTCAYYISTIYNGTADYARIQDKIKLISIVSTVIYGVTLILFLFNLINLFLNERFIYVINAQAWMYTLINLVFFIYIFATSITNTTELENNDVKQYDITGFSVTPLFIVLLVLEVLYSIFTIIISNKFAKLYMKVYEVPEFVSSKIQSVPIKKKRPNFIPQEVLENSARQNKNSNSHQKKKKKRKKKGKKNGKKR